MLFILERQVIIIPSSISPPVPIIGLTVLHHLFISLFVYYAKTISNFSFVFPPHPYCTLKKHIIVFQEAKRPFTETDEVKMKTRYP